jgi:hypothetical protein
VFLRCRGAIFINYLLLGENSKATTSTTMYWGRLLGFCTAGEIHILLDR